MKDIELKLEGLIGEIDLRALSEAIGQFDKLLRSVDVSTEDSSITLSGLSEGSARTTARASSERVDTVQRGMEYLRSDSRLPKGWRDAGLEAIISLHKANRRAGVQGVLVGADQSLHAIDAALAENATAAKSAVPESLGSVTGRLCRYSSISSPEASLIDDRSGRSVTLRFGADKSASVLKYMDQRVTVRGRMRRDPWSNQVLSVQVRDIDRSPDSRGGIPLGAGQGLLGRDWTGGQSSAEWIRGMRDLG
ncbi:hypothetical protein ACHABQ_03030 [Nesterenkonia aurantiaca]|uniref:hypothetical protein n=1 Tax=Nesterenkonia aurantiaca TaxID=1436010 RepID=UPI003EE42CD4